jgi:hypothetical protein
MILPFDEGSMGIDEVLQGKTAIDEGLHRLRSIAIRIALDPGGMVGHFVDHFPVRVIEVEIILKKIAVGIDVGHDQFLVNQVVALEEVSITGIIVDDHFIDFGKSVGIALGNLLILHPEGPVRITLGEALVSGDFINILIVQDLEDHREEIQSKRAGMVFDFILDLFQVCRELMVGKLFQQICLPFRHKKTAEGPENAE